MLGRRTFTQEELDHGREAAREQLAAYRELREATDAAAVPEVGAAVDVLEAVFFNASIVALDRRCMHRVRSVTGKDTNPLSAADFERLSDAFLAEQEHRCPEPS